MNYRQIADGDVFQLKAIVAVWLMYGINKVPKWQYASLRQRLDYNYIQ
jgi:hypothetical protein